MAHDPLGNAPQQGALHATPSMAADHDQVGWPVLRGIDDLGKRGTDLNEVQSGHLLREAFAKVVDQISRVFLSGGGKYIGLNAGVGGVYERGVDDMDECHLRSRESRQLCADISRVRGDWLAVDSNENLLEDHESLLELGRQAEDTLDVGR